MQFLMQRELVVTEFGIKDSIHLSRRGDVGLSTCYATFPFDLAGLLSRLEGIDSYQLSVSEVDEFHILWPFVLGCCFFACI